MRGRRSVFAAIAVFGIVSLVFIFVIVYPLFQGIKKDYDEAIEKKEKLIRLEEDKKRGREFEEILQRYEAEFVKMQTLFLDVDEPIAFFRFLDGISIESGVEIKKNPGVSKIQQGDIWPSLDVQIQGTGTFAGVKSFLQKVENGPYLVELEQVTITSTSILRGEEVQRGVKVSANLKVYTKP
jgi:hypothetical protein